MIGLFRRNNWKKSGTGITAWSVIALYLSALVAAPALHWHLFDHHTDHSHASRSVVLYERVAVCDHAAVCDTETFSIATDAHQSDSHQRHIPLDENVCPLCEFLRLAVPLFVETAPFQVQSDMVAEAVFVASKLLVSSVTSLPPCRAPPVFSG